jgi:putative membrane protein
MLDLLLTIAHHLLVFTLVAMLAGEIMLVTRMAGGRDLLRLAWIDAAYGIVAGLTLIFGFARVFFGAKGADYFLHNPLFWGKIAAFVLIGLLSIRPTLLILGWRRKLRADRDFMPPADETRAVKRMMHNEGLLIPVILVLAAAMVRGYGL